MSVPDLNSIFAPDTPPRYDGTPVKAAGFTLIVPKLSLGGISKHKDFITGMKARGEELKDTPGGSLILLTEAIPVITSAVQRNYPGATEDIIGEVVDAGTYGQFFRAIFNAGPLETAPGEDQPAT
jgi:hypothetical protein